MNEGQRIVCSGCGQPQRLTQQTSPSLPDGGWCMEFEHFGYYGGFSDELEVAFGKRESKQWSLCHDCVVKFFDTFPALAESFGKGHHPNFIHTDFHATGDDGTVHPSCCQFAWTWRISKENGKTIYDIYDGDGNGGWTFKRRES